MKSIKRWLAVLMSVLLISSTIPVNATEAGTGSVESSAEDVQPADGTDVEASDVVTDKEEQPTDDAEQPSADDVEASKQPTDDADDQSTDNVDADDQPVDDADADKGEQSADDADADKDDQPSDDADTAEQPADDADALPSDDLADDALEETASSEASENSDDLQFDITSGGQEFQFIHYEDYEGGLCYFWDEENEAYILIIPDENPVLPYEVQITYNGETGNYQFEAVDSTIEAGGYTFCIYFINEENINPTSLLPLEEKRLGTVDLTGYTPLDLTMVSVDEIFTGENALNGKQVVSKYRYTTPKDDYGVCTSDRMVNLSRYTYSGSTNTWEMIVGTADQLDAQNIRYQVPVRVTESEKWLIPTVYSQDGEGNRSQLQVESDYEYYDYNIDDRELRFDVPSNGLANGNKAYVSIAVNTQNFAPQYSSIKVYEGKHDTEASAMGGTEITDKIFCNDMSAVNAGYEVERYRYKWITMVSFDSQGNVVGCLPFQLYLGTYSNGIYVNYSMYELTTDNIKNYVVSSSSGISTFEETTYTKTLYKEYPANGMYYQGLDYKRDGVSVKSAVTAAFVGKYQSIAEATAAGVEDIKALLFGDGYCADYSGGVYFTIFVGNDNDAGQEIYKCCIKTVTGEESKNTGSQSYLSDGTAVTFTGLKDKDGNNISAYVVKNKEDSYAEFNYKTILVGADVDLSNLAPEFDTVQGVHLYAPGSSTPEESGKNYHDFSQGPVQYSAGSESGEALQNYWLAVVKASNGAGKLGINSTEDGDSKTEVRDGVIYSTREVMLDSIHDYVHDILFTNMGTEPIINLSCQLTSDTVELDPYWTLTGNNALAGFSTTDKTKPYGELPNMAKVRIRAKDGISSSEVSGTLTIKSGETTLMVLTLTGVIGNPAITTKEIPQAVKYVPYGTMIQNNNKYSMNKISYRLDSGNLPAGMVLKPNGEIYGVPTETGDFTFRICMSNSNSSFSNSYATFTLSVLDNTDENVNNATDNGYMLTTRIQNATTDRLVVSEGVFPEFRKLFLDGKELVQGVDYDAESGSTRITIRSESLDKTEGTHTIGIEFRTSSDELRRAAQNYNIDDGRSNSSSSKNNSSSSSSSSNSSSLSSSSVNTVANRAAAAQEISHMETLMNNGFPYVDIIFADGKAVMTTELLRKYHELSVNLMIHLGNGVAFNALSTDMNPITEELDLSMEKTKLENFAPGFDTFQIKALSKRKLMYNIGLHINVGTEYTGSVAYLFYYDQLSGIYVLGNVSVVNEIGNVMMNMAEITDVMVLIAQ